MNNPTVIRSLVIYAICVPLAIVLGFLLTDPEDQSTKLVLILLFFLLMLPLLFKWYHAWLITICSTSMSLGFLPGFLPAWMLVACIGFAIAIGHYALNRERKFLEAPSVTYSLVFLSIVVAVTAKFRGGVGFHAFGDESVGGKRYFWIWFAVVAYFVLISQRVPPSKRRFYTGLFLLGALTGFVSDFGSHLGPFAKVLAAFFPGIDAPVAWQSPVGNEAIARLGGAAVAAVGVAYFLVARYGLQGVLNFGKSWRLAIFIAAMLGTFVGGYRSAVIGFGLTLVLIFYFEGLLRSRLMPIAILALILVGGLMLAFSNQLPLSIQRSLAFLPLKLDPVAKMDAAASAEWRLQIWEFLIPQIPHYLLLGKGLSLDFNDMAMYKTLGNQQVGGDVGGVFTLAGDYHSGPLSVIIPFGIWGCIGFLWFLFASIKVLWANYKYGDPEIRKINTFLLSYFISKSLMFIIIFGGFYTDLFSFICIIGFSISLNGGVAKPEVKTEPQMAFNRGRLLSMRPTVMSS